MKDKIEVGEYVRFNNGEIGKVIDIKENPQRVVYSEYGEIALCSSIVKYSKELIDLVKSGDFVNGHRVKAVYLDGATKYIKLHNSYDNGLGIRTYKEDIKTILTKEQFEANCYKVGGEDGI